MKRYIKSDYSVEYPDLKKAYGEEHISGVSFDFTYYTDRGYSGRKLANDIVREFNFNHPVLGVDFRSADYSMYPEYAAMSHIRISQGSVDFVWKHDYSEVEVKRAIERALDNQMCSLIGIDFYSLDD